MSCAEFRSNAVAAACRNYIRASQEKARADVEEVIQEEMQKKTGWPWKRRTKTREEAINSLAHNDFATSYGWALLNERVEDCAGEAKRLLALAEAAPATIQLSEGHAYMLRKYLPKAN